MNNKLEELLNTAKLNELLRRKDIREEKQNPIVWALAIIGAIAAVAGIAYAVYRYCTPDYLEDFDDDFDDDYDDDFDDVDDVDFNDYNKASDEAKKPESTQAESSQTESTEEEY